MGKNKKTKFSFESRKVLLMVVKNFKLLMIVSFIAFIISIIISYQIKPLFKSTAIILPAPGDYKSMFGSQDELEQMLQVLNSEDIKEKLIKKFKLFDHYGIDTLKVRYPKTKLYGILNDNISISRTRLLSLKIEVLDQYPKIASEITNFIVLECDSIMNNVQRIKAQKNYEIFESEHQFHLNYLKRFADSLNKIGSEKGLIDYSSQSRELTKGYADALQSGRVNEARIFENKLKELGRYSGSIKMNQDILQYEAKRLGELKEELYLAKAQIDKPAPYSFKFIIEHAKPAEKKSKPNRILIVLVSTLSTFLLALLLLVVNQNLRVVLKD